MGGGSSAGSSASTTPAIASLQSQTSCYGQVIPVVIGTCRVPPNLIWYANFTSVPQTSSTSTGKGGGGGTQTTINGYSYYADVIMGVFEGPGNLHGAWVDKVYTEASKLGYTWMAGTEAQSPWQSVLNSAPNEALGYGGIAYAAATQMELTSNATVPNHNFMVTGGDSSVWDPSYDTGTGFHVGSPALVIQSILTNPNNGMGWPARYLDTASVNNSAAYTKAAGFFGCFLFDSAKNASEHIQDVMDMSNLAPLWSGGKLKIVPLADQAVGSWTPNTTPLYTLTVDDFIVKGADEDPITCTRVSKGETYNRVSVEFKDVNNDYASEVAEASDLADINQFGLRASDSKSLPHIPFAAIAQQVAQLLLQQSLYIRNEYEFKLGWRYSLLEPLDLVNLLEPSLGLNNATVRIWEVEEDEDGGIRVVAKEWPYGVASAVAYPAPGGQGGGNLGLDADPGSTSTPIILEPPLDLTAGERQLWIGTSGPSGSWGGCEIWASRDGGTYQKLGEVHAPSIMGSLKAQYGTPWSGTGDDLSTAYTVDVGTSGQLDGCGAADWSQYATLSALVDATGYELLSFEAATLKSAGVYQISSLKRALFGSTSGPHSTATRFLRLDNAIAKLAVGRWDIGTTLYFKFPAFNVFGRALQSLSTVNATAYTLTGSTFTLPGPASLTLAITASVPAA